MYYFYKKDGEIFVPEKINPTFSKIALGIIKTCKVTPKFQLKTVGLNNAIKSGKKEKMIDIMQKCFLKYKNVYESDMSLTGVKVEEVEESFFDDKDEEFLINQLNVLIDFAAINTVIECKLMALFAASCEKITGKPMNKINFFTNQDTILEEPEDEEEVTEE